MAKKRISAKRAPRVVMNELTSDIQALDIDTATTPEQLRANVLRLVKLLRNAREFGLIHVHHLLPSTAASERILAYLRMFVGQELDGEELEIVSGISEYARRVREWRVEFGWPIVQRSQRYRLERDNPDGAKAELWRLLNETRRSGDNATNKMLRVFRSQPLNTVVTTAQLRYVTEGKDLRRVRELRTQHGWRILTRNTGRPDLKTGQYVLVDSEPVEPHDRAIDQDTIVEVLKRDGNRCRKCGWHPNDRIVGDPRQYIEIHHITWHIEKGANTARNLATLCNVHHRVVHARRIGPNEFHNWLKQSK